MSSPSSSSLQLPQTLNRDVWLEIVKYFRLDHRDKIESTRQIKREALRSLALTSRQLTELALSELWRTIWSLKHVCDHLESEMGRKIAKSCKPWVWLFLFLTCHH